MIPRENRALDGSCQVRQTGQLRWPGRQMTEPPIKTVKSDLLTELPYEAPVMSTPELDLSRPFLRPFTANEQAVRAYVRRLVPQRTDADDVIQDVGVVLSEKFHTLPEIRDFRAWAFGVARFEVLAWLRDKGRDRLVLKEEMLLKIAEESAQDEPRLERQREALEQCLAWSRWIRRSRLMVLSRLRLCSL